MKKLSIFCCIFSILVLTGCQKGNESNLTNGTHAVTSEPTIEAVAAPENAIPPPIKTKPIGPKKTTNEDRNKVLSPAN